ncbi:MAG: pantoate--beta-alanine ligase [Cryomorphaceae bacterium]|nr:pantoate--beta-alanine ligase [Cryomorphaceae bacterium]
MEHIRSIEELARWKSKEREKKTGFVPTMGALHDGHLSLVRLSQSICDRTIVSIYVNPTQFNKVEDLAAYPNTLEADLRALEALGCDAVFLPSAQMLYPDGLKSRRFDFNGLDHFMEGAGRPGHFEGMATVVTRFFELIEPDFAVFGEKDYQQLSIIKQVVTNEDWSVEIVPGPISREADGLAMSSRNMRLLPQERKEAAQIYAVLSASISRLKLHGNSPKVFENQCTEALNAIPSIQVEYVSCCDAATLQPLEEFNTSRPARVFAAVQCGKVRLIDNLPLF